MRPRASKASNQDGIFESAQENSIWLCFGSPENYVQSPTSQLFTPFTSPNTLFNSMPKNAAQPEITQALTPDTSRIPPSPDSESLSSNTIPSLDQFQSRTTCQSLSTTQSDPSHLDQEFRSPNKPKQTQCSALHTYKTEHHALIAPSGRLPPELWVEVFTRCAKGAACSIVPSAYDSFDAKAGPLLLTHVCSWWRAIAISTPALWTTIRLVLDMPQAAHLSDLVDMWIARSGTLPLKVAVLEAENDGFRSAVNWEGHTALRILVGQSNRWADASFDIPPYPLTWQAFKSMRNNLSQLRSLSLDTTQRSMPNNLAIDVFEFAHQLSSLALKTYNPNILSKIPLLNLTSFHIHWCGGVSFHPLFSAMRSMPGLQKCVILCNLLFKINATLPDIAPLNLTSLTIILRQSEFLAGAFDVGKMLGALSLPSLSTLVLRLENLPNSKGPWDQETFIGFIRRSPALSRLALNYSSISNPQLEEILQQASTIQHLSIHTPDILTQIVRTPLLPNLRSIDVTCDAQNAFPQSLIHLVTSRGTTHGGGHPSHLRAVTLRYIRPTNELLQEEFLKEEEKFIELCWRHNVCPCIERPILYKELFGVSIDGAFH